MFDSFRYQLNSYNIVILNLINLMLVLSKSTEIIAASSYIPHGHCYLWQTNLVFLHVLSDTLIGIAYYAIPVLLFYFTQNREDVPFKGLFMLFSLFILSCGTTHFFAIWTLWHANYWIDGILKAITALVSIYTVFEIIPIIPQALALPSPAELEALNEQLLTQMAKTKAAQQEVIGLNEDLETRIKQRTKELEQSQEFVKKIINLIPNLVYIYDLVEAKIVYINKYFNEILGHRSNNLAIEGFNLMKNICHPDDLDVLNNHHSQLSQVLKCGFEYRLQDVKGEWHWLQQKNYIFTQDELGNPQQIISIASEVTEIKKSELMLMELNRKLQEQINEMTQLSKINDFLQVCQNLQEVKLTLGDLLKPLFPYSSGAIFLLNNHKNKMEIFSNWEKELTNLSSFSTKDCWALRKGNVYQVNHCCPSLYCSHHQDNIANNAICVPMIAQGQITGLLSLTKPPEHVFKAQEIKLAETVAKQITLIIANLKLQANLEYQSNRDALTGLYNRRYFETIFNQYIEQASEFGHQLGLVIIDIDYFKKINDVYGHQAGDLVLQEIAIYLKNHLRSKDIICRYGGEEIIIIVSHISLQDLVKKAKQLKTGISQLRLRYGHENLPQITASFGVAIFPEHGQDSDTLVNLADKALYQAKAKGRNRVICASPKMKLA